jgi:Family of unknown function (DUF5989)
MSRPSNVGKNVSFARELVMFLRESRKWYLLPIVVVILAMSLLIILGGTGAAPFIYTLF